MREIIEIEVDGLHLRGTCHVPCADRSSTETCDARRIKTGVLILNSGFLPRSAQSDVAVRIADAISQAGFPAFRFDLPGLGDSEGDLPEDARTFVQMVERGAFAPCAVSLASKLLRCQGLDRIVMGGLCGGGITSVYGAVGAAGRIPIAGVFVMDPTFTLVQVQDSRTEKKSTLRRWKQSLASRIDVAWGELRAIVLSKPAAGFVQAVWGWIKTRVFYAPRTSTSASANLPAGTNMKLIWNFEQLAVANMPILVVSAENRRAAMLFDYSNYLDNRTGKIQLRKVTGTNHSFAEGPGPQAVSALTVDWLTSTFAPENSDFLSGGGTLTSVRSPAKC